MILCILLYIILKKCRKAGFTVEEKKKSVDRRVLKTKRAIRNAFAKLMTEKDINDITIIELAETANINRKSMSAPYTLFEHFRRLINVDPEFFGYLLSMNGNINLITRIMTLLKDKTRETMISQLEIDEYKADIMIDFVLSGMLSVYQHWFVSDRSVPLEEVSDIISRMSFEGINGIVDD